MAELNGGNDEFEGGVVVIDNTSQEDEFSGGKVVVDNTVKKKASSQPVIEPVNKFSKDILPSGATSASAAPSTSAKTAFEQKPPYFVPEKLIADGIPKEEKLAREYEVSQNKLVGAQKGLNWAIGFDEDMKGSLDPDRRKIAGKATNEAAIELGHAQFTADENISKLKEAIEPDLEYVGENLDKFTRKSEEGDVIVDDILVNKYAEEQAKKKGLPIDGYYKNFLKNNARAEVAQKIIEPDVLKEREKLFKDKTGKSIDDAFGEDFAKGFTKAQEIEATAKTQINSVAQEINTLAKTEAEEIAKGVNSQIEQLNAAYQQQASQVTDQAQAGALHQEYTANFNKLQANFLDAQNQINGKYNQRLRRQADEIEKVATQKWAEEAEKYKKEYKANPELLEQLKSVSQEAYKKVVNSKEKVKEVRGLYTPTINNYYRSTVSSLGRSLGNLSETVGYDYGKVLGDYMENTYQPGSAELNSWKDLLDASKLAKSAGQLTGTMLPSMTAAAATTIATQGLGAPEAVSMLAGGLAAWTGESMDMAGNIERETFAATGDANKALKRSKRMWDAQMAIMPLYSLEMLPFMKGFGLSKNIAKRMAGGAAAEYVTEVGQEYVQNRAEATIKADKEFSEIFKDASWKEFGHTALNVAPVAILGAGGQIRGEKSEQEKINDEAKSFALKSEFIDLAPDQRAQFISDIVREKGKAFASAYISNLYTNGTIPKSSANQLVKAMGVALEVDAKAQEYGFDEAQKKVFTAFKYKLIAAQEQAANETDPILKQAADAKVKELEEQTVHFASGKQADYVVMTYPNGEQYVLSLGQGQNAAKNPKLQQAVADGAIKLEGSGKGVEIVNSVGDAIKANKKAKVEAEKAGLVAETGQAIQERIDIQNANYAQKEKQDKEQAAIENKAVEDLQEKQEVVTPEGFTNKLFDSNVQLGEAPADAHISEEGYNYRVLSKDEMAAIRESGGVFAREGKQKGGNKNTKYWTKGNAKNWYGDKSNLETIRVSQDKFNPDKVVSAQDVEVYNKETKQFEPLLKEQSPVLFDENIQEGVAGSKSDAMQQDNTGNNAAPAQKLKTVPSLSDKAKQKFKDAGFKVSNGSLSETDFGVSSYFYIERPDGTQQKVRVSDHSVENKGRMDNEVFINMDSQDIDGAIREAAERIDGYTKNKEIRDKFLDEEAEKNKDRAAKASAKWETIKRDFEGQKFAVNERTYQSLEEFKKKVLDAKNIIQTPLDKGAFKYEYSVDKKSEIQGNEKPSQEYIENYEKETTTQDPPIESNQQQPSKGKAKSAVRSTEKPVPVTDDTKDFSEGRKFALDYVLNDLVDVKPLRPKMTAEESAKMKARKGRIEDGKKVKSIRKHAKELGQRVDWKMKNEERHRAIRDIKKGKYNTVSAKMLLDRLEQFHDNGYFDFIAGTGNMTVSAGEIPITQIKQHLAEVKALKEEVYAEYTPEEVAYFAEQDAIINEMMDAFENDELNEQNINEQLKLKQDENERAEKEDAENGVGQDIGEPQQGEAASEKVLTEKEKAAKDLDDKIADARKRLSEKLAKARNSGELGSMKNIFAGFPELMELAALHAERGVKKFIEFVRENFPELKNITDKELEDEIFNKANTKDSTTPKAEKETVTMLKSDGSEVAIDMRTGGKVTGTIRLKKVRDTFEVSSIAVNESEQRGGDATKLYDEAVKYAKSQGAKGIVSGANETITPAIKKIQDKFVSEPLEKGVLLTGKKDGKVPPTEKDEKPERKKKKKILGTRAYEGEISEEEKAYLEEKGLFRGAYSQEERSQQAQEYVDKFGEDAALRAVDTLEIRGAVATSILAKLLVSADVKIAQLENTDTEQLDALQKEKADITAIMEREGYLSGEMVGQLAFEYENSDLKFNVEKQIEEYKAANNGEISPETEAKFRKLDREITQLKAQIAEAEEKARIAEEQAAIQAIQEKNQRDKKNKVSEQKASEKIEKAKKKILEKVRSAKIHRPDVFMTATPASLVWDSAVEAVEQTINAGLSVAAAVARGIETIQESEWYKGLERERQVEAEQALQDFFNEEERTDDRLKIPTSLIRDLVARGHNTIESLTQAVKEAIAEQYPDATDREIRDAITGYGKVANLNQEEIATQIRKITRLGRLISQMEDIQARKRPMRSGIQRDKLDAEERAKMKEVREAMKDLPVSEADLEQQLKTAHDAIKTRLNNQIEDLQKQLDENFFPEYDKKQTEYDAKEKELQEQIAELKEKVSLEKEKMGLVPSKELPKTPKSAEITRLEKQIEKLQKQLDEGVKVEKEKIVKEKTGIAKMLQEQIAELKEISDAVFTKETSEKAVERIEKSIEKIKDKINKNELEAKKKNKPVNSDPLIAATNNRLKIAKDLLSKLRDEAGVTDRKRLELAKKAAERRIADLQRRIREQDFSKNKPKPLLLDTEIIRLRAEKMRLQEEYEKEIYKAKIANRNNWEIAKETFWDLVGLGRLFNATLDVSFVGVQGGIMASNLAVRNPKMLAEAFANMFRFALSEKKTEDFLRKLKAQDDYYKIKGAKLAITEPHAEITAREEHHFSDIGNMLWNLIGSPLKYKSEAAFNKWAELSPFKIFERAAIGFLDTVRVSKYMDAMQILERQGKTFENDPQAFKNAADVVNTFTGRASLGFLEQQSKWLSRVFYSPRNWASVFKQTILFPRQITKWRDKETPFKPSVAQKMAVLDLSGNIATTLSMVTLAALYYGNDDDDETGVETDPRSSDFGKIKIGNTRVDPWGGKAQQVVLVSRIITEGLHRMYPSIVKGSYKTSDGDIVPLGTPYKAPTWKGLAGTMVSNKLNPATGLLLDYADTRREEDGELMTAFGQPYIFKDELKETYTPMITQTAKELLKDDPNALNGFLLATAYFGNSVNIYGKKTKKDILEKHEKAKENAKGDTKIKYEIVDKFLKENKAFIDGLEDEDFKDVMKNVKKEASAYANLSTDIRNITKEPDFKDYVEKVKGRPSYSTLTEEEKTIKKLSGADAVEYLFGKYKNEDLSKYPNNVSLDMTKYINNNVITAEERKEVISLIQKYQNNQK